MAAQPTTEIEIHSPRACIVTLRGEHDASSSEAVTLALMLARGYAGVLVDLSGCAFLDSSVISALLLAGQRARTRGGAVEIVVPIGATTVRRTLEIANVQMVLPFHATRAEGIAGIAAPPRARLPRSVRVAGKTPALERRATRARTNVTVLRARIADETTVMRAHVTDEGSVVGLAARSDRARPRLDADEGRSEA
jgi:anti-sigma B factor antagonist